MFLGWDRPALPEVVRRLAADYRKGRELDLGKIIIVVPGQRAGRRLQELLAILAEDEQLCLTPPEVVTEGRLPEMLYTPKRPFADELTQDLAWARAIREFPEPQRQHILRYPPPDDDKQRWLELGKLLRRMYLELAADGFDFLAVSHTGTRLSDFREAERWQALAEVQQRYLNVLDQQKLWDIQTARLKAIEFREIATERHIILVGTVDLNNTLRQMLDLIAEHVTAYVVSPEELADRFDAHGCLVPSAWLEASIPLRDEQLCQVDGPVDQAEAVTDWLASLGGRYSKEDVVIGVPDESVVLQLQRQLEQAGLRSRWVEGFRMGETAPYRLLQAAVSFAGKRLYEDLAALVRHPDLEAWLQSGRVTAATLPKQLDAYYNAYLPIRIGSWKEIHQGADWPQLALAVKGIDDWLAEAASPRRLRDWGTVFTRLLSKVYAKRTIDFSKPTDEALHRTIGEMLKACDRLDSLPEAFDQVSLPPAEAFQIALGPLKDVSLPPPADPDAVELLGWLELPLDDAEAMIITSFNEGVIPQSVNGDIFLPDQLRRELGIEHNERRYARDAYATNVLCHTRKELKVVFARRNSAKDPVQPSRFLFACSEETLIRRAKQFFDESASLSPVSLPGVERLGRGAGDSYSQCGRLFLSRGKPIPDTSTFEVPRPTPLEKPKDRFRVTEFRDYLACPYRYYLRQIRRLRAVDDSARELDGGAFGTLLHLVLSAFGRDSDSPRESDREADICEFLMEQLYLLVGQTYDPGQRRPAFRLQLEQARQRLRAFARHQAELRREGWSIIYAEGTGEQSDKLEVAFDVDGVPITLVGRIDRIDFHASQKKVRILDYKTGDTAKLPRETHLKRDAWKDLQLPLYRHLWPSAATAPADVAVELAYFNLPRNLDKTGVAVAVWDETILADADEKARQVIRDVRDEKFWPPTYPAPDYYEDLAAICMDNVKAGPVLNLEENGGDL